MNQDEKTTNEKLKKVASKYDTEVHTKVRMGDVVEIENSNGRSIFAARSPLPHSLAKLLEFQ
ncbi:hypothetical protein NIES4074_48140 [Cylindrospermum sp. NIES-4074]|nr:hypothetical protein NIES4074_48140 [Cylindrospermum sp. NIES-4074]